MQAYPDPLLHIFDVTAVVKIKFLLTIRIVEITDLVLNGVPWVGHDGRERMVNHDVSIEFRTLVTE